MIAIKLLKLYLLILAAVISVLLTIAAMRTFLVVVEESLPPCTSAETDFIADEGLSDRLAQALTYRTITYKPRTYEEGELKKFANFLAQSFPVLHLSPLVKRKVVNGFSLLYIIKGSDPLLKPYMLTGHMDVVPVHPEKWEFLPFGGKIANGYINGRGAIDAKHIILGILDALEFLLKKDVRPQRTLYLAFGHDEEGGGYDGAYHINQLLLSMGVKMEYILDEGTFVIRNLIPGVKWPTAMISVTEKGQLSLQLLVETTPGHSATPPVETAVTILARAVSKLPGNAFQSMFGSEMDAELFRALAPCASLPFRFVYTNFWLFKPAISWAMSRNPILSSFIKTTCAATMISGGIKENVLPNNASAIINLRVHPLQIEQQVIDYVKNLINDERVHISVVSSAPPHPISPFSSSDFGYNTIKKSIRQIYPESCVLPTMLVANTDTRWYWNLTDAIYRFSPVRVDPSELSRIHGNNEKIAINNYVQVVNFYLHLIKNSDQKAVTPNHHHEEL